MAGSNQRAQDLKFAQLRVTFVESLLEAHRARPLATEKWKQREAWCLAKLEAAERELERLKK